MSKTLMFALASALVGLSGVAGQRVADCISHDTRAVVSQQNEGTFTHPMVAGANVVLTEGITISSTRAGRDVVELGVTIAPTATCTGSVAEPGAAQIQLGLYIQTGTTFTIQAQTPTISLTADQVKNGVTLSRAVLFNGLVPIVAGGSYSVGFSTNNANLCLEGNTVPTPFPEDANYPFNPAGLPATFPMTSATNNDFLASALICLSGEVVGDPVFTGFHGQQFTVKGEADSVFNLVQAQNLQFNNRFIALESDKQSMNAASMKAVRAQFKHSKLLDLVSAESARPPATTAWNHAGTYMGESGITLGDSQLYVAPGAYVSGFKTVTLDGVAVPISKVAIELDGDIKVTRPSAFKLIISTPDVSFTIVNSDNFVNIEHAKVKSADAQLTGLLGQTANADWEVVQSNEFKQHLENDFKVASNKLF